VFVIILEKTVCEYQCFRYVSDARLCGKKWVLFVSLRKNVTDIYEVVPVESGEAQTNEQVWKEYFAGPLQWWTTELTRYH
jgi:hypothetical protein